MIDNRFKIIKKKLYYYLEEIQALKGSGAWYFLGFGVLIILLFPVLIFELLILLIANKDIGWFQSAKPAEELIELNADEVPKNLHDLIPFAKKWGVGDDYERGELMKSATPDELNELEEKVGSRMQEIWDWLSSYPEDYYSDTTYFFTYLMSAYDECDLYREDNNA